MSQTYPEMLHSAMQAAGFENQYVSCICKSFTSLLQAISKPLAPLAPLAQHACKPDAPASWTSQEHNLGRGPFGSSRDRRDRYGTFDLVVKARIKRQHEIVVHGFP